MPSSCSGSSPAGDPGSDDVHALVLRAWVERAGPGVPPRLRARLLELRRGRDPRPLVTTASVDEACQAVRGWLESLRGPPGSDDGDGMVTRRG